MNGWFETLALQLMRTTLVTSLSVLVVMWMLWALRIRSPRLHRAAWLLVLVQGWLLVPITWQVVVDPPEPIAPGPVFVDAAEVDVPGSMVLEASDYVAAPVTIAAAESINPPRPLAPEPFDTLSFVTGWGLIVWLTGVGTLVAMGAWRYIKLFAAGKPGELATDAEWLKEWNLVRESSTLRTPIELRTTRGLGPLVCWVPWVFLVLVPRTLWASLRRADRLAILRHELAHCERGDLWKNLVVRVLALPQWFNPLVWLAVRRFEEAGEWACDDRVAASAGSMDYAKTLLQIADQIAPLPSGAVGMASGVLTRRVERLLHYPNKEVREMRGIILPVLLVVIGLWQVVRIERVAAEETTSPAEAIEVQKEKRPSPRAEKMPTYVIEPPDVITVDIAEVVHKSPRRIQPYDQLVFEYLGPIGDGPATALGISRISPIHIDGEGNLSLGQSCQFNANNMTIEDARTILQTMRKVAYSGVSGNFTLDFATGAPQVSGEHLLGPDGKVHFGKRYGAVNLNGLTINEAKKRIEEHLSFYLVDPKVTVNVHSYNSKKYCIITKGQGVGDNVVTAPITGNETVMDAIAAIGGLHGEANIRIARPAPNGQGTEKVVYVDYEAITKNADTRTNYQLWPGDRLYVEYPGEAKGTTPKEVKQRTIPKLRRTPGGSWQPVEDESDPNLVGKMLLRKKERLERAPQTQPAYSESGVVKLAPEQSERVRYQIGLVIDPKQTLRAMELKKQGPIMVGESSLMLGMLRVLQKNELVRLFEGQNTVAEVGGESSNVLIHLEDSTILAKALQLDEPEDEDKLRSKGGFTLRVVEQLVQTNGGVAFEARAKLSQGQDFRQIDTAIILDEGQSGLASFATENDDAEAGDAYLLITRERVE